MMGDATKAKAGAPMDKRFGFYFWSGGNSTQKGHKNGGRSMKLHDILRSPRYMV